MPDGWMCKMLSYKAKYIIGLFIIIFNFLFTPGWGDIAPDLPCELNA